MDQVWGSDGTGESSHTSRIAQIPRDTTPTKPLGPLRVLICVTYKHCPFTSWNTDILSHLYRPFRRR